MQNIQICIDLSEFTKKCNSLFLSPLESIKSITHQGHLSKYGKGDVWFF